MTLLKCALVLKRVRTTFYLEPLGPGSKPGSLRVRNGAGWEGDRGGVLETGN